MAFSARVLLSLAPRNREAAPAWTTAPGRRPPHGPGHSPATPFHAAAQRRGAHPRARPMHARNARRAARSCPSPAREPRRPRRTDHPFEPRPKPEASGAARASPPRKICAAGAPHGRLRRTGASEWIADRLAVDLYNMPRKLTKNRRGPSRLRPGRKSKAAGPCGPLARESQPRPLQPPPSCICTSTEISSARIVRPGD